MAEPFTPPGPGFWSLDLSHFAGGTTPLMQWLVTEATEAAYRNTWPLLGIPAETVSMRFVNGFTYTRLRPLVGADRVGGPTPPDLVVKALARLHPEFRRRTKAAARAIADSPSPAAIDEWHRTIRPRIVARNLELQDVDLATLDRGGLADHLATVIAHLRATFEEHHRLHSYDLGPIGQLLLAGRDWGIASAEMVQTLAGASPSTAAPRAQLGRIHLGLRAAGVEPTDLDTVAAASPEVAAELADYLRHRGSVLCAGYDIDSPTLREAPDVILATIRAADPARAEASDRRSASTVEAITAGIRSRVPAAEQGRFDELLASARGAMDLRDENGPITTEWPCGLLRLVMLEAGRRLVATGRITEREHVFELDRDELDALVRSDTGPTADELVRRAAARAANRRLAAPRTLGEPEAPPPIDLLPAPLATMVDMVGLVISELGMRETDPPAGGPARLTGTGVGTETTVGTARVAETAEQAFDLLEDGDILVTRTTSPAYNLVLTLVGGLVTSEGGPMSHAAVLSRELGISAVVGAADAMTAIADGDTIEIDPVAGSVRVLTPG